MLEASELRIGNLVNLMLNHEDFETIYVDVTDLINIPHGGVYEPIPLTEEWLLKLCFRGREDFKWINIVGIQIRNDKFYLALKDLSNVLFHSVVEIKYVHQLQNLYFALTGEELNLK